MTMPQTADVERRDDDISTPQACRVHHWDITYVRRPVEQEVYTCLHCGATFSRQVSYSKRKDKRLYVPDVLPEWPTWDDIISEP